MKRTAWRLCKNKFQQAAFDGEGTRRYGGRWNSKGTSVVYTSESPSLAALEMLVHHDSHQLMRSYEIAPVHFDEALLECLDSAQLPPDWTSSPAPAALQRIGDIWATERRSAVLQLPSAVIPQERNVLLNPAHPDFRRVELGAFEPFVFDERLRTRS